LGGNVKGNYTGSKRILIGEIDCKYRAKIAPKLLVYI